MQSYEDAKTASPSWPNQVLVEARDANHAFDAYFDAVVNDLEPLVRWFRNGCDLDATRLELLQHFPDGRLADWESNPRTTTVINCSVTSST